MNDPGLTGEAILNATAAWFLLKALEVGVFVVYDTYCAIEKWIRNRDEDQDRPEKVYDRWRGWIEYVSSGAGFLNRDLCRKGGATFLSRDLCRKRSIILLLVSTIIPPFIFFCPEIFMITLGNVTRTCKTSSDPNVVSSPSLVLFGEGRRHGNLSTTFDQVRLTGLGNTRGPLQPCITWSSVHAGVDFLSAICGSIVGIVDQIRVISLLSISDQPTGVFLHRRNISEAVNSSGGGDFIFILNTLSLQSKDSLVDSKTLGSFMFFSQVVVNGKNLLYQNASTSDQISEEQKNQLIQDVRGMGQKIGIPLYSTYFEDERHIGFVWDDAAHYLIGVIAVVFAVLAQVTREPIKTAARMSDINLVSSYDISCEEDFRLPRTASIIIIIVAVTFRLILVFKPPSISSVEYALDMSKPREASGHP